MDMVLARGRLDAERTRLLEVRDAADRLSGKEGETPEQQATRADQHSVEGANETIERELDHGVFQRVEAELAEIEAALSRLDGGVYGRCEICGSEISEGRLEVKPAARYCIEDQARAEKDQRRR